MTRKDDVIDAVEALFTIFVFPLYFLHWIRLFSFKICVELVSLAPGEFGVFLRRAWYQLTLQECGIRLRVDFGGIFQYKDVKVGDWVGIGKHTIVSKCDIGNDVRMGGHIYLLSGSNTHNFDDLSKPIRLQGGRRSRIKIGNDVWVGANAIIMADVSSGSVIGASAVVTKTFDKNVILVGSPARVLRKRGVSKIRKK